MSDFGEGIINRLADNCSLKDMNNPASKVIDKTVGAWLDEYYNSDFFSNVFLSEAEGAYLDVIGTDYSVYRKINESDEDYRNRLLIEPLDKFNLQTLYRVYNIQLLSYKEDKTDLTLLSDNHLLSNKYYIDCSDELWNIILNKFITSNILYRW